MLPIKAHLESFLKACGRLTLGEYYRRLLNAGSEPDPEFVEAVLADLKESYGAAEFAGRDLSAMLSHQRYFFAANHAGIENHPQLIASSLLTQLAAAAQDEDNFVLACSLIMPRSRTAPIGFYLPEPAQAPLAPQTHVNFMTRRHNKCFVYSLPAVSNDEIQLKLQQELQHQAVLPLYRQALQAFKLPPARDFCAQCFVHNTKTYARFAAAMGHKTYFLNEERIAVRLLVKALQSPRSPLFRLLFHRSNLERLLTALCGSSNAWRREVIFYGSAADCTEYAASHDLRPAGTALFYELDARGHRRPLVINLNSTPRALHSRRRTVRFTPDEICEGLAAGTLLPNLFLVYCTLALGFKVSLAGGPFFADYSKPMLTKPAAILGLPPPVCAMEDFLQSFLLPIKVTGGGARAHALLHLDLSLLPPLSLREITQLEESSIAACAALSRAEELLRLELDAEEIAAHESALQELLKAPAVLERALPDAEAAI